MTVDEARRALVFHFTGNADDEFDGPCEPIDAYAEAIRQEERSRYEGLDIGDATRDFREWYETAHQRERSRYHAFLAGAEWVRRAALARSSNSAAEEQTQ